MAGLSEFRVSSALEVLKLLAKGDNNRAVRSTEYNDESSRSHAILQLRIELEAVDENGATVIRKSKLNLIDLAGSEKWNVKTKLGNAHAKELTQINKSLSALGNVISALTESGRKHIPYRDSKLTRLLQDCLGGSSRTVVIATVSPALDSAEETSNTLLFADRAKRVMSKIRVNQVVDDAVLLSRAQEEIARLRKLLSSAADSRTHELEAEVRSLKAHIVVLEKKNSDLQKHIYKLKQKLGSRARDGSGSGGGGVKRRSRSRSNLHDNNSSSKDGTAMSSFDILGGGSGYTQQQTSEAPESTLFLGEGVEGGDGEPHTTLYLATTLTKDIDDEELDDFYESIDAEARVIDEDLQQTYSAYDELQSERAKLEAELARLQMIAEEEGEGDEEEDEEEQSSNNNDVSDEEVERSEEAKVKSLKHIAITPTRGAMPPILSKGMSGQGDAMTKARGRSAPSIDQLDAIRPTSGFNIKKAGGRSYALIRDDAADGGPGNNNNLQNNRYERDSAKDSIRHKLSRSVDMDDMKEDPSLSGSSLSFEMHDIGTRIKHYKFRHDYWYPATIVDFDGESGMHRLSYDGDKNDKPWFNLRSHKYLILSKPVVTSELFLSRVAEQQRRALAMQATAAKKLVKPKKEGKGLHPHIANVYGIKLPRAFTLPLEGNKSKSVSPLKRKSVEGGPLQLNANDNDFLDALREEGLEYTHNVA